MHFFDRIVPAPQVGELTGEAALTFDSCFVRCCEAFPLAKTALQRLNAHLEQLGLSQSGTVPVEILLTLADAPEGIPNPDQGYRLTASQGKITVEGFGQRGFYYGVVSLIQCLREKTLPAFTVLDYPTLKTRGHFLETRYGTDLMELEDWKQVVDSMVFLKENQLTVSVYGCWTVQFDGRVSEYVFVPFKNYPDLKAPVFKKYYSAKQGKWIEEEVLNPMYEKDFLGELMAYGRENGIEVVPMVNSLGHNTLIPRLYPEVSAKDENGEPACTGFCTSNPKTYELLFNIYDEIIDRYAAPNGVTAFDIGMDEVRMGWAYHPDRIGTCLSPWCKCPQCAAKTQGQIIMDHAARIVSHLKEKGMKTVYMYNDMVVEHSTIYNANNPENRVEQFLQTMGEKDLLDVVCLDWWAYTEVRERVPFDSIRPELGIRATLKPWNGYYNWAFLQNAVKNNHLIAGIAVQEHAEGIRSYSTWDRSYHRNNQIQADYAWNYAGTGTPQEATARYARRYFPTAQAQAEEAFACMDDFTRRTNTKDPNNKKVSRFEMLFGELIPYQYTYYKRNRDYPRNYPGELVPKLRQQPEFLAEIRDMFRIAQKAYELFDEIVNTPGCDEKLAVRFRYENLLYMNICRDWLTVVEMDGLAQQFAETGDAALPEKIAALAKAQKQARLEQISLLETIKEPYLIPSHARNQSIPMQYFADVEAYLAKTPACDVKLDMTDNRHLASERFWFLR